MSEIRARFALHYPAFALDVDLNLPNRGVSVLFGHSGSGKTTLLRCIAGLERARDGEMHFNGDTWQSGRKFLAAHRRPIGYVFQEASLFSHLSVRGNLDFAVKRAPQSDTPIAFDQAVQLLGIDGLLQHHPQQLSGGERQRVAIARALLIQPRLLLMDEPLAALDLPRKQEILPYLEGLKQELALPIIYVSHAADEVARLADYIVGMENGRVVAAGPLAETLARIDSPLHLGEDAGVVIEGLVLARDGKWGLVRVHFDGGELWVRDAGYRIGSQVRVRVLARDISLALQRHTDTSILNTLPATVESIAAEDDSGQALVRLKVGNIYLVSRVTRRSVHALELVVGQSIWAQVKSVAVI
ncbi:molybdenum ABC transporter ATP-binding protein [Haliea sp. E17]|uniref:molybdenum ABC transporter ATP-binding protein n=1 Tax=Haliea sp. E17 TaxID=3401576 RepID=UPI003AAEFA41